MSSSTDQVVVEDVHEVNSVAGIKHIWITAARGHDETYNAKFRLNTSWIFPDQKLQLATVRPGDTVSVVWNYFAGDLEVQGDFVTIISELGYRPPICHCLQFLVTDGYQLICPNKHCPLTLAAKLERLSLLKFVPEQEDQFWPPHFDHLNNVMETADSRYSRPFAAITTGQFWGQPGATLSYILEHRLADPISLQTFMIESYFNEWYYNTVELNNSTRLRAMVHIGQFHAAVEELFHRRDTDSSRQNLLMVEWLWSLGLESLSRETIERLVYQERMHDQTMEPILFYTWMLTHSYEMVGEMGIDIHEARAITREIRSRRLELFDLFKHYCITTEMEDLVQCFEDLEQRG